MFIDVFVVVIGKGVVMCKLCFFDVLCVGFIFGVIEVIILVIGWLFGCVVFQYVEVFDYWIVFGLFGVLGVYMIINGICLDGDDGQDDLDRYYGFWWLVLIGLVMSIDVMVVGIGLVFLDVNIGVMVLVIGLCIFSMVIVGIMFGCVLGNMVGKCVEIIGGLILIIIGVIILYEYFSGVMV